jgi:tetraacyldisaccharide 4'-kinase
VELLRIPAALFGVASGLRGRLYDRGWLPLERVDVPVISVGNLTAGGTGKTPAVALLARELLGRGLRPGVASRGYRSGGDAANDEGRLLGQLLPGVPLVQDPDRARGARSLLSVVDVILLDDGFQHRRLARDLDLVLVDATRPWGLPAIAGGAVCELLPRGLLRESPAALARADLILLTRADQVEERELDELSRQLEHWAPGVPQARAVHRPLGLRSVGAVGAAGAAGAAEDGGEAPPLGELAGRTVDLVSAVGNPEAFERTVRALGAEIAEHRRFWDHHAYAPGDLEGLAADGRWLLTTAKDAVKLHGVVQRCFALDVELEIGAGRAVLEALLDSLPEARRTRERRALHEGTHG